MSSFNRDRGGPPETPLEPLLHPLLRRGGPTNMKYKPPYSAAIFFGLYFTRQKGAWLLIPVMPFV